MNFQITIDHDLNDIWYHWIGFSVIQIQATRKGSETC